ncbi:hypothetical protein [Patulibacter minatonensis]|uniref:hypothetical protein n=1 Tax=Patulibacter minatonensis TaxID=298163 RepID=UPI0004B83A7F|nr:hypothetical protein [Patulibacter minatonensis]
MTVGWYVHHHGAGHLHRFLAVRELLGPEVVGLGSLARPASVPEDGWVQLPGDVPDGEPDDPTAGGTLHWAPRRVAGLRARTARIAAWVAEHDPAVLVVDVSVEVALLGRLLSVPTVVVAQRGRRTDRPHAAAYAGASAVLAPWTAATHAPGDGPPEDRLVLCGAVSRFDRLSPDRPERAPAADPRRVLVLVGAGGHDLHAQDVVAAAAATPGVVWEVAGALRVPDGRVTDRGPDADVRALLHATDVVVGTAGGNVVAEVAAARRPLILLPQARPFGEQRRQASLLQSAGLAATLAAWPAPEAWPELLRDAAARPVGRWSAHHDGRGAERMATAVRAVARGEDPPRAAATTSLARAEGPARCA